MRTIPRLALFDLALAACLAACGNDFPPYSRLDRLRVLAVAAEPATPPPGQVATLSTLIFAPAGATPSYRWSWCPAGARANDAYACPFDAAAAAATFAPFLDPEVGQLPDLDLGAAPTAQLPNPFSPAALAGLCATGLTAPAYAGAFDCEGGFPVTIVLDVNAGSASLRAGFVVRLPVGDAFEINHNPLPGGLALAGLGLLDGAVVPVTPGQTIDLDVDIPANAVEQRSIPPSEGTPGQRLERLTTTWFADAGAIENARTSFIDGETTLAATGHNRWTAPAASAWPTTSLVELDVVLRDDRGGVGWLRRTLTVERAP